jgi:hypothetical protein
MTQILSWSTLSTLQLGSYAEYFVKMGFTLHGFDVFTAEVDNKGVDFVIRKHPSKYYAVQVKSSRRLNQIFFLKDDFKPSEDLTAAIVLFTDNEAPSLYLVPSLAWLEPDALFRDNEYPPPKKSKADWGLNLSKRNLPLLEPYAFEKGIEALEKREAHKGGW